MCGKPMRTPCLALADHLPGEAAEALLNLATGGTPQVAKPGRYRTPILCSSRCPASVPGNEQRRRTGTRPRISLGEVDGLSPSGTAAIGRKGLQRPRAGLRFGRHRQDHRRPAPGRLSGPHQSRCPSVAHHFFRHPGECSPNETEAVDQQRTASWRTPGSALHRCHRPAALRGELRPIADRYRRVNKAVLSKKHQQEVEGHKFSLHFLLTEWEQVVDAWQLETWEAYRDVTAAGPKNPATGKAARCALVDFRSCSVSLTAKHLITYPECSADWHPILSESKHPPFDFAVVDEAQDISVAQLRFLAALGAGRPNSLFFAGDLGQRIFQQPFSWKALGVDIRGRSRTLRINYRTSHQIRMQADRLLGPELSDVDGNTEDRRSTISVFNGPEPTIMALDSSRRGD